MTIDLELNRIESESDRVSTAWLSGLMHAIIPTHVSDSHLQSITWEVGP